MQEDILEALNDWLAAWTHELPPKAVAQFIDACELVRLRAEDEVSYAVTQAQNGFEGWTSPDELKTDYIQLPLDDEGFPIYEVEVRRANEDD